MNFRSLSYKIFAISIAFVLCGAAILPSVSSLKASRANHRATTAVVINEFLADPNTLYTEEWIELYNPQSEEVDLSGYILDDITTGGTNPYTIPAGMIIPANGFLVFWQDTTGIGLNNGGDTVNLLQPDGTTVIDSYTYYSSADDVSYGRSPDGSDNWETLSSPTPGVSNGGGAPVEYLAVTVATLLGDPGTYQNTNVSIGNALVVDMASPQLFNVADAANGPQLPIVCQNGSRFYEYLRVNDTVNLTGSFTQHNTTSQWQLIIRNTVGTDEVVLIATTPIEYQDVTVAMLLAAPLAYQNTFVKVTNVTVAEASAAWNFEIIDQGSIEDETLTVYCESGGTRPDDIYPEDIVTVQGVLIDYQGTWEISIRRDTSDAIILVESAGPPPVAVNNYILQGKIVTMESEDSIIPSGNVLIKDGIIEAVWSTTESPPAGVDITGVTVIDTGGLIFPSLIDTHNHVHYNTIPIWDVPKLYTNRYQWGDHSSYKPDITYPKTILNERDYTDLLIEAMKYAEVKELVGGGTAIQGSPSANSGYNKLLVRNIEQGNFGQDKIYQNVREVDSWDPQYILDRYNDGRLEVFFAHLGEGTDQKAHDEFQTLKDMGLNIGAMVHIHATAWDRSDFQEMAAVGAKMVWSPASNLLLYGDTADVDIAWEEGVCVALAPDWAPSGAKNVLGELKIADQWNQKMLDDFFTDYNLTQMVTTNAAKACEWEQFVGRIKPGLHADLLVIDDYNPSFSPYRMLINAIDFDVKLVTIDGDPLYGMVDWMKTLKAGDYEIVEGQGFTRALDFTEDGIYKGDQKFADVKAELEEVMTFTPEVLYDYFDVVQEQSMSLSEFTTWLDNQFSKGGGLHPVLTDPIFTYGDQVYFDNFNNSINFNYLNWNPEIWTYYQRVPGNESGTPTDNDTDADDDGLPNTWEDTYGLDKNDPTDVTSDTDHDGLNALTEYEHQTSPIAADSDSDGLDDGTEVIVYQSNPTVMDTNGNGEMDNIELPGQFGFSADFYNAGAGLTGLKLFVSEGTITIVTNSILSKVQYDPSTRELDINVLGTTTASATCTITLPEALAPFKEDVSTFIGGTSTEFAFTQNAAKTESTITLGYTHTPSAKTLSLQLATPTSNVHPPQFTLPSTLTVNYGIPAWINIGLSDPDTPLANLVVTSSSAYVTYIAANTSLSFLFTEGALTQPVTVTVSASDGKHVAQANITVTLIGQEGEALVIEAVTPAHQATDISPDTVLTLRFNLPVESTTLGLVVKDTNNVEIDGITAYNPGTRTLTFTPGSLLAYGTEYHATLSKTATSTTGEQLNESYTWSFSTSAQPASPTETTEDSKASQMSTDEIFIWVDVVLIIVACILALLLFMRRSKAG